jgi:hypothetical protein
MKGRELILSGYEHGMKESHDDDVGMSLNVLVYHRMHWLALEA